MESISNQIAEEFCQHHLKEAEEVSHLSSDELSRLLQAFYNNPFFKYYARVLTERAEELTERVLANVEDWSNLNDREQAIGEIRGLKTILSEVENDRQTLEELKQNQTNE